MNNLNRADLIFSLNFSRKCQIGDIRVIPDSYYDCAICEENQLEVESILVTYCSKNLASYCLHSNNHNIDQIKTQYTSKTVFNIRKQSI